MVVGLTGGIASGKSFVSALLSRLGMLVIDADEVGRGIMTIDCGVQRRVLSIFGDGVMGSGGQIDRGAVARIMFRDPEKRRALEQLLHPLINEAMWNRAAQEGDDVVLDVPLLIETWLQAKVDVVVVVYATQEVQIERLVSRDGIGQEEAIARIESQMPLEEKVAYADYVINNNGSKENTQDQVSRFYRAIREKGRS